MLNDWSDRDASDPLIDPRYKRGALAMLVIMAVGLVTWAWLVS